MIEARFRAIVVCVDPRALDPSFVGRAFDEGYLKDLPEGVDPCGENGEFHTFVHDGPLFRGGGVPRGVGPGPSKQRGGRRAERDHELQLSPRRHG